MHPTSALVSPAFFSPAFLALLTLVHIGACGESGRRPEGESSSVSTAMSAMSASPPSAEGSAESMQASAMAGPRATDESFTLEARAEEGYGPGSLAQFGIHIAGRGEWHLNQDFPVSIDIAAPPALGLAKESLGKGDAAEFGDEAARFDVPFTPSGAGEHPVQATVRFAMCNPQSCVPKTETLAINLHVRD